MRVQPRLPFTLIVLLVLVMLPFGGKVFAGSTNAPDSAAVTVAGEVAHPLRLDEKALAGMPHHDVTASAHGETGTWSGVALSDILAAAGVPLGEKLRGRNMLLYLRIGAADGYHVIYSLAELDPAFRDGDVILADRHDGKPLDAREGPFRIIAPHERRPARWIREVTSIDVLRAPAQ